MRVIALETSERIGSLAALKFESGEMVLAHSASLPDDQRSAQSLLPALHEMLAKCGWQAGEIDLVCVTTGPGSFTGLRLGVTVAKTFAYSTRAKLVGVPTLSAMATSIPTWQRQLWTILDAQRQELFVACFEDGLLDASWAPKVSILGIEEWLTQLQAGDTVVGPPLKKLAQQLPDGVHVANEAIWAPQAEMVGRLGITAFQNGKTDEPMQLVPQYYRKSAAEEKADAASSK